MKKEEIAAMIDHTILAPNISSSQVDKICEEAKEWHFASVCINPVFVTRAAENLKDSSVKVCTVIAFPLGATSTKDKVSETQHAIENGADEIDMVINISAALDGRFLEVGTDISEVVKIAKTTGEKLGKEITVKVIL